jgi:hypothetical protein
MDEIQKKFIETYQCPGCVCGSDVSCFEVGNQLECGKHVAGTRISGIGRVFLGMTKGFNLLGSADNLKITGFKRLKDGWGFDKFNIPVWKFKDDHGNTIVRGLSPRINEPFLHIFMEDCIGYIDCLEITVADMDEMD